VVHRSSGRKIKDDQRVIATPYLQRQSCSSRIHGWKGRTLRCAVKTLSFLIQRGGRQPEEPCASILQQPQLKPQLFETNRYSEVK
jgi:hypothetical protein